MSIKKIVEDFQEWLHQQTKSLSLADYRQVLDEIGAEIDARQAALDEDEK